MTSTVSTAPTAISTTVAAAGAGVAATVAIRHPAAEGAHQFAQLCPTTLRTG